MSVENGEVIRCAVRMKSPDNTDIVNVYHYKYQGTTESDANILDAVKTHMETAYNDIESQMPNSQTPYDIKIDVVDLESGKLQIMRNVGTTSWGGVFDPSGAGEGYAAGVAVLIILRTIVGKVFGRKYIGWLTEGAINGQKIATGTPTTQFLLFMAKLLNLIATTNGNLQPGILSTRTLQWHGFAAADIASEVGYQRRRAIRKGS